MIQHLFCLIQFIIISKCNGVITVKLTFLSTMLEYFLKCFYCLSIIFQFKAAFRFQIIQICNSVIWKIYFFILKYIIVNKIDTILVFFLFIQCTGILKITFFFSRKQINCFLILCFLFFVFSWFSIFCLLLYNFIIPIYFFKFHGMDSISDRNDRQSHSGYQPEHCHSLTDHQFSVSGIFLIYIL